MYTGAWPLPEGVDSVPIYFWIHEFAFNPMLEMFVFISGYIFAYQIYEQKKQFTLKNLIYSKFKRLILPSIFFSLLYMLCFYRTDLNLLESIYKILSGAGHLWFLPMIFWVFITSYLIAKLRIKEEIKLIGMFFLSIFSFVPLPFSMTRALYFLFFFYLSFYVWNNKDYILNRFANVFFVVFGFVAFVIMLIITTLLTLQMNAYIENADMDLYEKILMLSIKNCLRLVQGILGVLWLYISIMYLLQRNLKVPQWSIKFNSLCMGIFVFHQFILQYLYYYTSVPQYLGSYLLPWFGLLSSFFSSLLLTWLVRKTSVGRKLL